MLYAILQFGVTAIVYFNAFIVGELQHTLLLVSGVACIHAVSIKAPTPCNHMQNARGSVRSKSSGAPCHANGSTVCMPAAEALFFGGNFNGKAPPQHFASPHDAAWHNAKIALISTVLWVPVAVAMIYVRRQDPSFLSLRLWMSALAMFALPQLPAWYVVSKERHP